MKLILKAIRNMIDGVYHYVDEMVRKATESKPDWNQNDPTAQDYVKNRPFWTDDPVETLILEELTVNVDGGYYEFYGFKSMLFEGETYIVTLNGIRYECVAWWNDDWEAIMLGNGAYADAEGMGEDVPFAIDFYSSDNTIYLNAEDGEYTLSIAEYIGKAHTLNKKYLPDSIVISENIDPKYIGQIFSLDKYEKIYFEQLPDSYNDTITVGDVTLDTWKEFSELLLGSGTIKYSGYFLDGVRGLLLNNDLSYYKTIVFSINTVSGGENFVECSTESFTFEYDETNKTVKLRCDYRIGFAYNVETNTITPIT